MAHASVFGNDEKVAIVRRVIMGMVEAGVERVLYMPDPYRLVRRALDGLHLDDRVLPVEGEFRGAAADTTLAARAIAQGGAKVLVSLGGDGTNRAIALGTTDVPLLPISTGTNNVFPVMVEGTVVGLAAAAVATGAVDAAAVSDRSKLIQIRVDGQPRDLALIDAVALDGMFVGSRAVWDLDQVREAVLTRATPDTIGLSAIGGMVESLTPEEDAAMHIRLAKPGAPARYRFRAAIAPGLVRPVALAAAERMELGAIVRVAGPALFALDGEREFQIRAQQEAELTVTRNGPPVVSIGRCLQAARDAGFLRALDPAAGGC